MPILWGIFFLNWSMSGDQVSRLSRVTPQITSSFDQFDWFLEECYWSGLDEAPSGTREYYRADLETSMAILHSLNQRFKVVEVGLQVADEQRRLAGRGYGCRVIRVEG
jgi:hypothetical protein